ncbi:MAG: flagellar biosynthetic protein FliO [Magnetovibrio sp.]|nr:flagellar biosynthetic protein FliO [Magnetovibrio sp.]
MLTVLVRRYGLGMVPANMRKGQDRRLSLVEVLPIDAKRRAILIRRDDVEHLVIVGSDSDTVVETGIKTRPDFSKVLDETTTPPSDKVGDT